MITRSRLLHFVLGRIKAEAAADFFRDMVKIGIYRCTRHADAAQLIEQPGLCGLRYTKSLAIVACYLGGKAPR